MKICRFTSKGENKAKFGFLKDEVITAVQSSSIFDYGKSSEETQTEPSISLAEVKFLPPTIPSKIVCVGRNYAAHAKELGNEVPTEPLLFLKAPSSLITHGETIILPQHSNQVEHEGELGVIIKQNAKNIRADENPLDYVLGYVCLNDVTARDLQRRDVQFTRAKSFDTFCPIGHFIETDLDPTALNLSVSVNGAIKQTGNTMDMIFSVAQLIQYISEQMTLLPGDLIATGTPSGVSQLEAGDVCSIEIDGLGILRNPIERVNA